MKVLIVKTSSLGDVIQSFSVLDYLHARLPHISVDWLVEEDFSQAVAAHPLVRKAIAIPVKQLKKRPFSMKAWIAVWRGVRKLRREEYELVFDLQGNCKSALFTAVCRGRIKVGFDWKSVREWPNILATHVRFPAGASQNIRAQYIGLMRNYFRDGASSFPVEGVRFRAEGEEFDYICNLFKHSNLQRQFKVMVCPGSKWKNKQLPLGTWIDFLQRLDLAYHPCFVLIWGSEEEQRECDALRAHFPQIAVTCKRLSIPAWQYLMGEMGLIITVDSGALHLSGTTRVPGFSIFGPTAASVFKPEGEHHFAYQGKCPYGREFLKQCPILRSCKTGACIRELSGESLFAAFAKWRERAHHLQ